MFQFTILIDGTSSTGSTINCDFDVFSPNKSIIYDYVSECGGTMIKPNTARVSSVEAVEKLSHKLLKLTIPVRLSAK
jgi:hypothetical protein